jgi:hypothetical protein
MATEPQRPAQDAVIEQLRNLVGMPREEALAVVQQEGLDGLRVRVAAQLYATRPLTSGEAAEQVGLRNRGLLLRYLDAQRIAPMPLPDEPPEQTAAALTKRMAERLGRR